MRLLGSWLSIGFESMFGDGKNLRCKLTLGNIWKFSSSFSDDWEEQKQQQQKKSIHISTATEKVR